MLPCFPSFPCFPSCLHTTYWTLLVTLDFLFNCCTVSYVPHPRTPDIPAMLESIQRCIDHHTDPHWVECRTGTEVELYYDLFAKPRMDPEGR